VDHLQMAGPRPVNFLVVGSDSRADLTREERRRLALGDFEGERADTLFVLQVGLRSSAILAFPRDLYVTRCDGSQGRINAAVALPGGPSCLVETVRDLSGIPIHHYVEIGFAGFVDIVDAVGGVELCLDEPIDDWRAGIDLPAGCQRLDGADALGYVRTRQIGGDLERIRRQQEFLRALTSEMVSPITLLHIPRLYGTAGALGDGLIADSGFRAIGPLRFGIGAMTMATGRTVAHTVPNEPGRRALLSVVEGEAEPIFARFRDGSILREAGDGVQPGDVEVAVLNGAGISGLAGQVAEELRGEGFVVVEVGNTEPTDTTVVRHPPGQREEARLLTRHLPRGVGTEEDGGVAVVTLVLGADAADG
jgi:LCP family protein required for cell wall assembly